MRSCHLLVPRSVNQNLSQPEPRRSSRSRKRATPPCLFPPRSAMKSLVELLDGLARDMHGNDQPISARLGIETLM
jgi:hypothetical protein